MDKADSLVIFVSVFSHERKSEMLREKKVLAIVFFCNGLRSIIEDSIKKGHPVLWSTIVGVCLRSAYTYVRR